MKARNSVPSNKPAKRHHFNPAAYLRRWEQDNLFNSYCRRDGNNVEIPKNSQNTFIQNNLYTILLREGEPYRAEEKLFMEIDREGDKGLTYLANCPAPTTTSLKFEAGFIRYLYFLQARNPRTLKAIAEIDSSVYEGLLALVESNGIDGIPALDAIWNNYETALDRAKQALVEIILHDQQYIKIFGDIQSYLGESSSHLSFFTNDYPLQSFPGIATKNATHIFPISPKRVLIMCQDTARVQIFSKLPADQLVSLVNLLTIANATEVIARSDCRNIDHNIIFNNINRRREGNGTDAFTWAWTTVMQDGLRIG